MNKEIINEISKLNNLNLSLIKQENLPNHFERQIKYICVDKNTNLKYLIVLAYTDIQKHRLNRTINNIKKAARDWKDFFKFNLPIVVGYIDNAVMYVLYEYFTNANKLSPSSYEFDLFLKKLYKEKSYKVKVTDAVIEKIMNDIIIERCPNDIKTQLLFKNTAQYKKLRNILHQYDELEMVQIQGDAKSDNILMTSTGEKYLIGFEYGRIDLPIGFDLYVTKRMRGEKNIKDIPYQEFHETLYSIHHVGNNAKWLRYHKPLVKLCKKQQVIKIRENGHCITIPILKKYPLYKFDLILDFQNLNISPFATKKVVEVLNKNYNKNFTIYFKNCPYYFENLIPDGENLLSFSGIINKNVSEPKNLLESIKNTQAYINYSRILPFLKPYWLRALLAILICIPIGGLDAVIALSLKPYMDLVVVEKSIQAPWYIPLGIVAFTILQGMLNYFATYLNTWVGGKITNDLKMTLYKKLLTFQTAFFDHRKSGDIVFRFNADAETACSGLLENMKTFTSRLFSSLSLVGVLFYNSWQLAIIAITVLACAFLPLARIRKRIKGVMDKSVAVGAKIITAFNETFAGNKTITAYNLQKYQENKFHKILSEIFSLKIKLIQRTSWLSPMMHVIVSIGIGLAIGYGSHLIITGQITSGNFVSFITALVMLYTPIKNLGNNFNAVQFSFLAIERVFGMLELAPTITEKENAIKVTELKNDINIENVCFEYIKNKPVLKNINLNIKKGETIALVGNSGGGKSTIVNLIPRFYDVTSGSIKVDGNDLRDLSLNDLRDLISIVFQDNFLFSGTIRENILLGRQNATKSEIKKAIEMAYLDDFIATLKDGLDTQIGERGMLLSGGQKQRVAIARAFIKDSPIVILDEATSALDNKSEAIVQKAIDNLMHDKTVFVIAHRLSTIKNANRIAVINEGELVELGTHEELMKIENGQYKALYEMQFKKQEVIAT